MTPVETSKRESLWGRVPDYRVDIEPNPRRVRVHWRGATIADSTHSLIVRETNLSPVIYFPRQDVDMSLLVASEQKTFCPFKGEASYWSLLVEGHSQHDAVWSYEDPFDEVAALKNALSFYRERVDWEHPED